MIASLDDFLPRTESSNIRQLSRYLMPLAQMSPSARLPAVPAMLRLIERYPDAELGTPGPLVHEIEAIPGYETLLMDSLLRQPTSLSVWMANRILNSELVPDHRASWLAILAEVLRHPNASDETKKAAADFLEYQIS